MLSSKFLKEVMTEAYPIIERQINDAKVIASFRELVTANGGDWSSLKALMKAHVEDSLDESGDGKRVRKILDKADSSNAYAEMLGLANMNEKNFISDDEEQADSERDPISALLSNSALGLVRASELKKSEPQPTKAAGQASLGQALPSSVENEVAEISTPITEPQPSQPAGSDLTSLAPHEGQVAPIQPETATETPSVESANAGGENVAASENAQDETENTDDLSDAGKSAEASASVAPAPRYAAPGVVTWESTPPEGVERHPYSNAFGTLGQDIHVIADDVAKASAQPIVKIGNVILDGWARYMVARGAIGLDGHSTEYSVVQYDGIDPLLDCIRWNIAGRVLSDKDKQTVVARLSAIEPKRKADILKAVAELAI